MQEPNLLQVENLRVHFPTREGVVRAVEGVDFVTIAEFQRGDPAVSADDPPHADIITANGIITLGINELPVIPAGEFYAGGIALPNVTGGY